MKVSVIVAAYNIQDYIERCLDSIINQTLKDIEVIVVNDGSTDKTRLRIEKFSDEDARVRLINQENKGLIEARKCGLNVAKGEYILFVDGDDWLELNALDILYKNAKKNNSDIVLYNAFKVDDSKKDIFHTFNKEIQTYSLKEFLSGEIKPAIWAKFMRLDYINSSNIQFPSNISFAEDLATSCSLFIENPKVTTVDIPLYNYYIRMNSITNKINSRVLEVNDALNFIKRKLDDSGMYSEYKKNFEYLVYYHLFFGWFLTYVSIEQKYNVKLYQQYKSYNININSNVYIREKISNYPLKLKIKIHAYNYSYKLGKLYDGAIRICKRVCKRG